MRVFHLFLFFKSLSFLSLQSSLLSLLSLSLLSSLSLLLFMSCFVSNHSGAPLHWLWFWSVYLHIREQNIHAKLIICSAFGLNTGNYWMFALDLKQTFFGVMASWIIELSRPVRPVSRMTTIVKQICCNTDLRPIQSLPLPVINFISGLPINVFSQISYTNSPKHGFRIP